MLGRLRDVLIDAVVAAHDPEDAVRLAAQLDQRVEALEPAARRRNHRAVAQVDLRVVVLERDVCSLAP